MLLCSYGWVAGREACAGFAARRGRMGGHCPPRWERVVTRTEIYMGMLPTNHDGSTGNFLLRYVFLVSPATFVEETPEKQCRKGGCLAGKGGMVAHSGYGIRLTYLSSWQKGSRKEAILLSYCLSLRENSTGFCPRVYVWSGFCLGDGLYRHETAVTAATTVEADDAVGKGEQRVVASHAHVLTRIVYGAALANDDVASDARLPPEKFDT